MKQSQLDWKQLPPPVREYNAIGLGLANNLCISTCVSKVPNRAVASSGSAAAGGSGAGGASLEAYDEFMAGTFADFMAKSATLGGDTERAAGCASAGFTALRDFLVTVSQSKK